MPPLPEVSGTTYRFDNLSQEPYRERAFRLFILHPGSLDSELEGEIVTCRLKAPNTSSVVIEASDPGDYEALSYHWGTVTDHDPVVNIHNAKVRITNNLDSALRALRHRRYNKRRLWIDALCIDQKNQEEKSLQISHMSIIFNSATAVRVWLGPNDADSELAFDFVRRCLASDVFDRAMRDPHVSKDIKALVSLMKRPWFSRRWIVQEIAVARKATLHCGSHELEWHEFADVISQLSTTTRLYEMKALFKKSPEFHNHADYLGDISELGAIRLVELTDDLFHKTEDNKIRDKNFSLEALMSTMSAFEASVAHDIVYAILWLSNDAVGVAGLRRDQSSPASPVMTANEISDQPSVDAQLKRSLTEGNQNGNQNGDNISKRRKGEDIPSIQISGVGAKISNLHTESADQHHLPRDNAQTMTIIQDATYCASPPIDGSSATSPFPDLPTNGVNNTLQPINAAAALMAFGRRRSLSDAKNPTEKRQMVFAQLRNKFEQRRIYLDYSKSIFEVCREVLEFAMSRPEATLDILCRPWAPDDPHDKAFPSWIPRLSNRIAFKPNRRGKYQRVNANPLLGKFDFSGPLYRASHNLTVFMKCQFPRGDPLRERSLLINGLILHTIQPSELKSNATSGTIPADWRQAAQWQETPPPSSDQNPPPDPFWRTLVGNRNTHGRKPPLYWRRACSEAFQEAPTDDDLETSLVLSGNPASSVREFLHRVQEVVWNRRLARITLQHTNTTTLCLVPKNTQPGDLVCLLYGCNVPVVLHSQQSKDRGEGVRLYGMVGECYVHGMMDGELNSYRKTMPKPMLQQAEMMFELV
ncbi:HET-domain-containing protein [Aureobasidium pullulans]|uniref:HET-domain-containing protein n=1 Tax=Aureobasidium pullulans TaxID=5580 RepID=A0A4V4JV54_AURPU|nr:HET-domain-containing protein [Aureobasidium pullulans]